MMITKQMKSKGTHTLGNICALLRVQVSHMKQTIPLMCFDFVHSLKMLDYTVIAIPFVEGSGSYLHTIKVEYEEETTKMRHVRNATTRNDVFQVVQNRKSKDKQHIRSMGFKPKTTFENVGTSRTGNVNNNVQDESKAVLYEDDDYDIYDNYDIQGLSKSNWCFVTRWVFVFEVLEDARLYLASLVRKKGQEANPYEDYREFPSVFCLKINHGGTFTPPPMTRYKGGKVILGCFDIDSDTFSIVEVTSMLQELGYENPCMAYYYKKPNSELENGLVELVVDKDVYEMLMYVDKFKVIELYTDHTVKKQHVLTQEPLATIIDVTQPGSSSGNEAEVDVSEDEWLRESLKKLPIKSNKGQQSSRKEVGQSSRNGSGSENGSGSDSGSDK
ncbi:hypothetical protein Tco_1338842 [Tanacetum coccineum]